MGGHDANKGGECLNGTVKDDEDGGVVWEMVLAARRRNRIGIERSWGYCAISQNKWDPECNGRVAKRTATANSTTRHYGFS